MFFRKRPPPNAISVYVTWKDNPWIMETELYQDMLNDFANDPDEAEHVWNGAYGHSQGAILAKLVNKAEREGRVREDVVFDPQGAPVEVSSDIGYRDTATWWFWQRQVGGFKLLRAIGESGMDADDWIPRIREELEKLGVPPEKLGLIWLPPDARAKTFQSKHSSMEKFLIAFPGKVAVLPGSKKLDQISAARTVINSCAFNRELCEDGIDGLLAWEYEWNDDAQVFSREPLHNWASHWGDGFSYGAQVMQGLEPPKEEEERPEPRNASEMTYKDLDELLARQSRGSVRV